MMWWQDGMDTGGWIMMTVIMLAFWSLVVFGGAVLFRGGRENRTIQGPRERDSLQILDERFARGEIDTDEYRSRLDALRAAH